MDNEKDDKENPSNNSQNVDKLNIIVEDDIMKNKENLIKNDEKLDKLLKSDFRLKIKNVEEKCTGLIVILLFFIIQIYLKTFIDITNGIEINRNKESDNDAYEDDDIIEDNIEDANDEGLKIDNFVSKQMNTLFTNQNLTNIYNKPLIINLINNCNIILDQYIFNDFDKLIVIKELLYDFEYHSISMINNMILNFDILKKLDDISIEKEIYNIAIKKLSSNEIINHNLDYLTLNLTLIRNILENNKNISMIIVIL